MSPAAAEATEEAVESSGTRAVVPAPAVLDSEDWAGTMSGWGLDGEFGASDAPPGLDDVVSVDAHGYMGAAVHADGTATAWLEGWSDWDFADWAAGLTDVTRLAVGGAHLVSLHEDGTLDAIGWDAYGQSTPPADLDQVVAVDAGGAHNLALRADGTVAAWGDDSDGQGTVPPGLDDVVAISAGSHHNLALRADGTVVGWGYDRHGQTRPPAGLTDVVAVSAGSDHSVALRADGTVVAWGHPNLVDVPGDLTDAVAISAGHHTLALRADGTVAAWGSPYETWGGSTSVPVGLHSVVAVVAGGPYSFVVVDAGADSPLPDTTPPEIRDKGTITKAATSARGARVWFTPPIVDDVFTDPNGFCAPGRGAWYALGTTVVSCWAQDWAGNETRSTYEVRITWSWSGLMAPFAEDGTSTFVHGDDVPVQFKVTEGSHGAPDARAALAWAPVVDGVVGERVPVADAVTGAERFTWDGWKYVMTWDSTTTPGPGAYELSVDLGDGVERTALVDLT